MYSIVQDINNAGHIVGFYADNLDITHGFLKTGTGYISIDYPGALQTWALGINNAGQVVGKYLDPNWPESNIFEHGFLYDAMGCSLRFEYPADPGQLPSRATEAYDINNAGQIVGKYWPDGPIVPSPIPASALLMISGLLGVMVLGLLRKS